MLNEIFKAFVLTSLIGSVFAVILTIIRPITKKKFGYHWHYYIWLAVLIVMLLPVRFPLPQSKSASSPMADTQITRNTQTFSDTQTHGAESLQTTAPPPATSHRQKIAELLETIASSAWFSFGTVWLFGAAVMAAIHLIGYIRLLLRLRKSSVVVNCPELTTYTHKHVIVRVCPEISSPFMTGLFRPTLVLPDIELNDEQLDNILRHETTHLRRNDIPLKWFAAIIRWIHWFNPIAYYITRQIGIECEISCDLSVISDMSNEEKHSYINTILSLLSNSKAKAASFTTGMTSSKKILKRRFMMMKNKLKISKSAQILSVALAIILTITSVFAGGVLANELLEEPYTIEVLKKDGEKINFKNKPLFENNIVYLPLRELCEKISVTEQCGVEWNDGKIIVSFGSGKNKEVTYNAEIADDIITAPSGFVSVQISDDSADRAPSSENNQNDSVKISVKMPVTPVSFELEIGSDVMNVNTFSENTDSYLSIAGNAQSVPILRNGTTYIPFDYADYMFSMLGETDQLNLICNVWDRANGGTNREPDYKDVSGLYHYDLSGIYSDDTITTAPSSPEDTIHSFFRAFSEKDFNAMKLYCTDSCIQNFFKEDSVFGMTEASLKTLTVDSYEYLKSSNDFNIFVSVNMKPSALSVYDPSQTDASFYVCLLRQSDGTYLIDRFTAGL